MVITTGHFIAIILPRQAQPWSSVVGKCDEDTGKKGEASEDKSTSI